MKKTILTGASIMALSMAGPAFAQSTSTVDQTGNANDATVGQTGSNTSDVDQVGDDNAASVTQETIGAFAASGNASTIDQNGTFNTAEVIQENDIPGSTANSIDIEQRGNGASSADENNAFAEQYGAGNIIDLNQQGSDGVTPGNSNVAELTQDGETNEIVLDQLNSGASAAVFQAGNGNFADASQGRPSGTPTAQQELSVLQIGDDNTSNSDQRGANNFASVFQNGIGNTSNIAQPGPDNSIGDPLAMGPASVGVLQVGNDNASTVSQGANNGVATIDQIGDNLTSFVTQTGRANFATADVNQSGTFNTSTILQDAPPPPAGPATQMVANVTQGGTGNVSEVSQTNTLGAPPQSNNLINVTQSGIDGFSDIFQNGHDNSATLMQGGTDSSSMISQVGSNNVSNVTQN